MATIQTTQEALTAPGVVKSTSLELFEDDNQVLLTVELSTGALADAFYEELSNALASGDFRLGPLVIRAPSVVREG